MSSFDWLTSDENVQINTRQRFVVSQFIDNLLRTSEYVGSSRFERSPDALGVPRPVNTSFSPRTSDLRHEDELAADDEWSEVDSSDGQQRASNTPVEPNKGFKRWEANKNLAYQSPSPYMQCIAHESNVVQTARTQFVAIMNRVGN